MGATEQVSVSGGCFRKERRTLLHITYEVIIPHDYTFNGTSGAALF